MKLIYLITGIVFLLSLLINYKLKRNNKSKSGNVFLCLSLFVLIGYILEIVILSLTDFIKANPVIIDIYINLYYIFILSWYLILNAYVYTITDIKNNKLFYVIEAILFIFLSLLTTISKNSLLTLNISILIINTTSIIRTIIKEKYLKLTKSTSIIYILTILFVLTILQIRYINLEISTTIMLLITYLIYLYI